MGNVIGITVKAYDEASAEIRGITQSLERMQPAFQKMAAIGGAAFVGLSFGIVKAVEAAGRAEEIETRFNATFDKTEERMREFVSTFSDEWNRAESDIKSMSATVTGTLTPATNLSEEQMAKMTRELVLAGEGLAAYDERVLSGTQAVSAMTKAMVGGTDQLLELGYNLRVATVKEQALEMGLIETSGELDSNSKALATYALIMEQSQSVIGALIDAEGTYAETKRVLKAAITETSEQLGEVFLPLAKQLLEMIIPIVEGLGSWFEENQKLAKVITIVATALAGFVTVAGLLGIAAPILVKALVGVKVAILGIGAAFTFLMAHPILLVFTAIAAAIILLVQRFRTLAAELGGFSKAWEFMTLKIKKDFWRVIEAVVEGINKVAQYIPGLSSIVGDGLEFIKGKAEESQEAFDAFKEEVKKAAEDSEDALNSVGDEAGTMANSFGAVESRITKAMTNSEERITSLRESIKGLNNDLADIEKQYGERRTDEIESYNKRTAKIVAGYELDIRKLKEEALREEKAGNKGAAEDLFNQINEKEKELNKFYSWNLEIEDDINWEKEKLQMSELELLRANHFEELQMIEEERKEARAKKEEQLSLLREQLTEEIKILEDREREYKEHQERVGKVFVKGLNYQIDNLNKFIKFVGENPIGEYLGITGKQIPNIPSSETDMKSFLGPSPADFFYNQLTGKTPISEMTVNVNGGNYLDREAGNKFGEYLANKIKTQLRQYQN